ncbi:MAG: 16S rRNA (guanine(527)-N(7))-methyltransferase RsmG [Myxococcota bacterium]
MAELDDKVPSLVAHWRLVQKWGARINLTSVDADEEAAWVHYRDSLEVLCWWQGGSLVDIGSGAGFPGVPLAIARPEAPVTLLEPRRKRASFLEVVRAELGLRNLTVICGRVEDAPPALFQTAVSRATFSDEADLRRCLKWVAPAGSLIAMRAGAPMRRDNELHGYDLRGATRLLERWRPAQLP